MSYPTKEDYLDDVDVDLSFDNHPSQEELEETVENIRDRGIEVKVVDTAADALNHLKDYIPKDASIMNGHSTTLEEIGFVDYLKEGDHDWYNLHEEVFGIEDDEVRHDARRDAQTADYFLGSVNAIPQSGELVAADASGSRVGAYPYAAKNVLLVSGINKVVEDLDAAQQRLEAFAYPLEDARAKDAYGVGSAVSKQVVIHRERSEHRIHLVLVKQTLGF